MLGLFFLVLWAWARGPVQRTRGGAVRVLESPSSPFGSQASRGCARCGSRGIWGPSEEEKAFRAVGKTAVWGGSSFPWRHRGHPRKVRRVLLCPTGPAGAGEGTPGGTVPTARHFISLRCSQFPRISLQERPHCPMFSAICNLRQPLRFVRHLGESGCQEGRKLTSFSSLLHPSPFLSLFLSFESRTGDHQRRRVGRSQGAKRDPVCRAGFITSNLRTPRRLLF